MANDSNKITDDIRGGTWFANESNLGDLKKYVTSGQEMGGSNLYVLDKSISGLNILAINGDLRDGSFTLINSGHGNYIDKKYRNIGGLFSDALDLEIDDDYTKNLELLCIKYLKKAGVRANVYNKAFKFANRHKNFVTFDLIISKALKEKGYDGLLISEKIKRITHKHLFLFSSKVKLVTN